MTDPGALLRLERWYKERLPVSETCIVALPAGSAAPVHLHAVLIPDFVVLKERRQPNTQELLSFEFQKASKMLSPAERPDSFAVRARALPRRTDGEPDRERLRMELTELAARTAPAAVWGDALGEQISNLIREFRPGLEVREDSNLELDLKFDSLDRVLLICAVEKAFGLAISSDRAARIFTVGDLVEEVRRAQTADAGLPAAGAAPVLESWREILSQPLNAQERALADSILKPRPVFTFAAWSVVWLLRAIAARRFRLKVHGREYLPAEGSYLLIANHCSHLDPLFLLWSVPFRIARRLSFLGHTEYFGSGWKGALARKLKLVPVDPNAHALEGMKLCAEALRRDLIGAVFPEGERSADGAQQRFHRGIALLARHLQVPIVPVAIAGTYEVLPRGEEHIRYAPVQVSFGAPLRAEAEECEQDLLARAWAAVSRLRGEDALSREPIPRPMNIQNGASA